MERELQKMAKPLQIAKQKEDLPGVTLDGVDLDCKISEDREKIRVRENLKHAMEQAGTRKGVNKTNSALSQASYVVRRDQQMISGGGVFIENEIIFKARKV